MNRIDFEIEKEFKDFYSCQIMTFFLRKIKSKNKRTIHVWVWHIKTYFAHCTITKVEACWIGCYKEKKERKKNEMLSVACGYDGIRSAG